MERGPNEYHSFRRHIERQSDSNRGLSSEGSPTIPRRHHPLGTAQISEKIPAAGEENQARVHTRAMHSTPSAQALFLFETTGARGRDIMCVYVCKKIDEVNYRGGILGGGRGDYRDKRVHLYIISR